MNKKTYIAPEMEIMNIETIEMMAQSLVVCEEEVNTETGQMGHGRRGSWGNLWE